MRLLPSRAGRLAIVAMVLGLSGSASAIDDRAGGECPEAPEDAGVRRTLAKQWFADAQRRQSEGDELGALRAYQCSLKLVPHAFTAYNLGKLAEKTGDIELAVDSYRAYLKLTPEAPDAVALEARIVDLESRIGELKAMKRTSGSEPPPVAAHKPPPPIERPRKVEAPRPVEPPRSAREERSHTLAWVAMGSGTALLATGVVFNVMSRRKMDEFNRLWAEGGARDAEANATYDTAKTYVYTSYALLWTGGAAAATGLLLYFWPSSSGNSAEASRTDTRLSLVPMQDGAALFAAGRF